MDLGLTGKTALVTGASKGIGRAVAETLAAEGCALRLVARSGEALAGIAEDLGTRHSVDVRALGIDITAAGAIEQIAAFADGVDVLVNNAGAIPYGDLWAVDETAWRAGWELKVFGYINLIRVLYPAMRARGGGTIVNVIGIGGEHFDHNYIAGVTGNAALMAFTRALGGRALDHGMRVVGLNPGPVATERLRSIFTARNDAPEKLYPGQRVATPQEIADAVAFLASPRSAYTSGTILTIDGGIAARDSM